MLTRNLPLAVTTLLKTIYGANVITNGTFDTDLTGWSDSNTPTLTEVSGGRAHVTGDAAGDGIFQSVLLVNGARYELRFDYEITSGALRVLKFNTALSVTNITGSGNKRVVFVDDGLDIARSLQFQCHAGAGEFYLDNITLRRIL